MNKTLTLIAAGALVGTSAHAAGISVLAFNLNDAGNNTLASSSKTMVVIDVDGDGFGDFNNWDGSTFLPDPDDWIVVSDGTTRPAGAWNEATGDGDGFEALPQVDPVKFSVVDSAAGGLYSFASSDAAGNNDTTVGEGDAVGLFYFPGLDIGASAPGQGQAFGFLNMGTLPGPTGSLTFQTPQSLETQATFTTIPEPTSLALLGLGGLLVARRRRG